MSEKYLGRNNFTFRSECQIEGVTRNCRVCGVHGAVLLGNTREASRGRDECCLRHVEFEITVKRAGRMDLALVLIGEAFPAPFRGSRLSFLGEKGPGKWVALMLPLTCVCHLGALSRLPAALCLPNEHWVVRVEKGSLSVQAPLSSVASRYMPSSYFKNLWRF